MALLTQLLLPTQQVRLLCGFAYALIVDLPEGITTVSIHAESPEQAFMAGHELFPGCRLAMVLADGQPGTELD